MFAVVMQQPLHSVINSGLYLTLIKVSGFCTTGSDTCQSAPTPKGIKSFQLKGNGAGLAACFSQAKLRTKASSTQDVCRHIMPYDITCIACGNQHG